jgi:hypothetical protein
VSSASVTFTLAVSAASEIARRTWKFDQERAGSRLVKKSVFDLVHEIVCSSGSLLRAQDAFMVEILSP